MHDLDVLPTDWREYVHVDGKPYFHHAAWGVVTESYVRNPETRTLLENWYHQVKFAQTTKKPELKASDDLELYLTLLPQPAYYFVNHPTKSVFWLDDLPLEKLGIDANDTFTSFGKFP